MGSDVDKRAADVRGQFGALPYRLTPDGDLEILLITSRERKRWIVPKGWPMKGRKGWEAALIEARQEAGVTGTIRKHAVGSFFYDKIVDETGCTVPCKVKVFPLLVTRQLRSWREAAQREAAWYPAGEAAAKAADTGLGEIIAVFTGEMQDAEVRSVYQGA